MDLVDHHDRCNLVYLKNHEKVYQQLRELINRYLSLHDHLSNREDLSEIYYSNKSGMEKIL